MASKYEQYLIDTEKYKEMDEADLRHHQYVINARLKDIEQAQKDIRNKPILDRVGPGGFRPRFTKDFTDVPGPGARTLDPEYIGTHKSGWTIYGEIHEDYFEWVNEFCAVHENQDWWICGTFEGIIEAESENAYEDFIKNHPYHEWDYGDI